MSKLVGSQLDLQKIPVKNLVAESSATAPSSPVAGQLWLDTSVSPSRLKVYENTSWVEVSNTGTLNPSSSFGGDVSGTYDNLQIAAGAVGSTELASNAVTTAKIADANVTTAKIADSNVTTGKIADSAVTTAKINDQAVTGAKVADAIKDAAAGTASLRTLGTSSTSAMAGNTTLSSIAGPTADVSLGGYKITSLGTPTAATDAATKGYVDGVATGLDVKQSVRVATTAALASGSYNATGGASSRGQFTSAPTTIDGVTLANGDRVLVKNQSSAANGIWVVTSSGTWDRAADFDSDAEVTAGAFTFVEEGTVNADTGWVLTTNNPITLGGSSGTTLAFTQFSGAGSYIAGDGLTLTGNTFDVVGTSNRISVAADSIDIASTYVGQTSITTLGTVATGTWSASTIAVNKGGTGATDAAGARVNLGATGKYAADLGALTAGSALTITHSLGTTDVVASFRDASTGAVIDFAWAVTGTNTITVTADLAYSANAVRVVVVG